MSAEEHVRQLAEALANGSRIDWGRAEATAQGEAREAVRRLREFAELLETAAPAPELEAPNGQWAHLRLVEWLGQGTSGQVYRAFDPRLEREVALKLLRGDTAAETSPAVREARLLARLRHPNVVTVFGVEHAEGRSALLMEYVRGRTLQELIEAQGPLGAGEAALIGLEVCRALAALHGAKLLHRDVKAQNVMREEGGRVVLMDLGTARDLSAAPTPAAGSPGTPLYMAPEVLAGQPHSVRSDLYGLGVLLFYLVTGSHPVQASNLEGLRAAHARRAARSLRDLRPDLPEAFVRAVERALAPVDERFASAGEMQEALALQLGRTAGEAPAAAPRRRPLWLGVLATAAGIAAVVLSWQWRPRPPASAQRASEAPQAAIAAGGDDAALLAEIERQGSLHFALGSYAEARTLQERALALRESGPGGGAGLVETLAALAWIHWAEGDDAGARTLARRALAVASAQQAGERLQRVRADLVRLAEGGSPGEAGGPSAGTADARLGDLAAAALLDSLPYEVEAHLVRDGPGAARRLEDGARVAPGDRLSLELRASVPLHVYVLDEDERGQCFLLFPLPGQEVANPLSPGRHRLPGRRRGQELSWMVTSTGGREHVLLVASPAKVAELEQEIRRIPPASVDRQALAAPLAAQAAYRLRGIGGLTPTESSAAAPGRLFGRARRVSKVAERTRGVYIRRIVLDNP